MLVFIHPHVVLNVYDFLYVFCGTVFVSGVSTDFHCTNNKTRKRFSKYLLLRSTEKVKNVTQVWKNMRENKKFALLLVNFTVNYKAMATDTLD